MSFDFVDKVPSGRVPDTDGAKGPVWRTMNVRLWFVQGPRSLAEVGAGARKILSSVVSDTLTLASSKEKPLTSTLFRIGSYEFREPDCSQILMWSRALGVDPVALVNTLEKTCFTLRGYPDVVFTVEQGAIVSLAWDVIAQPIRVCPETFLDPDRSRPRLFPRFSRSGHR